MAHRVASRGGGSNGLAPLCVKDKRKAKAAAATAAAAAAVPATANARGNGNINNVNNNNNNNDRSVAMNNPAASHVGNSPPPCCAGSEEALSPPPPCRLAPVVIERSEIIRLASQYTPCAGCSAAVKGLLQRPIQELRLVNAVVEEGVRAGEEEAGGDGRGRSKGGGGEEIDAMEAMGGAAARRMGRELADMDVGAVRRSGCIILVGSLQVALPRGYHAHCACARHTLRIGRALTR